MLTRNADLLAKGAIDVHAIMEVPRGLKHEKFSNLPEITRSQSLKRSANSSTW